MSVLIKYPRTPHLPWSPGMTSDDRVATKEALDNLRSGQELVVTEKMDGGNLTMYRDAFHGRSLDSGTHPWDTRAKRLWSSIRFNIPDGWRVSGESLQARRSVAYDNLPGVFLIFGVWDENNFLLSWDDMVDVARILNVPTVPLLYRGTSFVDAVETWGTTKNDEESEGFVVRSAGSFHYDQFGENTLKFVRANHVRTRADWRHRDDFPENTFVH